MAPVQSTQISSSHPALLNASKSSVPYISVKASRNAVYVSLSTFLSTFIACGSVRRIGSSTDGEVEEGGKVEVRVCRSSASRVSMLAARTSH